MVAGVLAVQLVNFTALQFVPMPGPPAFTVEQVAAVLRTRQDRRGEFRIVRVNKPPEPQNGRAVGLGIRLARSLSVAPHTVRLSFRDPPMLGFKPRGAFPDLRRDRDGPSMMVGDFTAAVRDPDGGWLSVQPVRSGMAAWRARLVLWLLAALVTVLPFAWTLARWVSRPIAMFAEAAERIGRDPRATPLPVEGPAEISHAADALNEMQCRLNRYVDDRTLMIGAIAHDLRTPLMRLSLRIDRVPEELRTAMERDIEDMEAMISAGTAYVREAAEVRPRRRLDLRSLAESVADDYADRGEPVTVVDGDHIVMEADAVSLRSVFDNLVGNALRYAGHAEICLEETHDAIAIVVRDRGPGVDAADLDRLFEPFFRAERSRNRDTGGIGLGLASVRGVARAHGGDAVATNRDGGGLIVRVMLPY